MRAVGYLILASCSGSATQPLPPPATPPPWIALTDASWPELGLRFTSFAGIAVDRTAWPRGGVAIQAVVVGDHERADWIVRAAPDETMQSFDDDHQGWTRSEGPPVGVCGQTVPVAIATHAAEDITCVMTPTGNHPDHIPARAAYAVAFAQRGMTVVATFTIEAQDVERWRPIALAFLGSLRCR